MKTDRKTGIKAGRQTAKKVIQIERHKVRLTW